MASSGKTLGGMLPKARDSSAAGLYIAHNAEDFGDGEAKILVLADRRLLDEKGADLAEGNEELINAELTEQNKRTEAAERKRKSALPVYSGVDDGSGDNTKHGILYQYDDEHGKKGPSLIVTESGVVKDMEAADRVKRRVAEAAAKRSRIDLSSGQAGGLRIASDYYTKDEMASIEKPKRKKALRKTKLEDESDEDLDQGVAQPVHARPVPITPAVAEDDDAELNAMLARARRLAAASRTAATAGDDEERRLAGVLGLRQPPSGQPSANATAGGMVFTSTTEFAREIQAQVLQAHAKSRDAGKATETADALKRQLEMADSSQPVRGGVIIHSSLLKQALSADTEGDDRDEDMGADAAAETSAASETEPEDEEGFLAHEPQVSKGAASALRAFSVLGALADKEVYVGRARDARLEPGWDKDIEPKVVKEGDKTYNFNPRLEYLDENGRRLTTKEAFRVLSYAFHGIGASQKSRDHRMRMQARERKIASTTSRDTPLNSLAALAKAQEVKGQAHLVLGRGAK